MRLLKSRTVRAGFWEKMGFVDVEPADCVLIASPFVPSIAASSSEAQHILIQKSLNQPVLIAISPAGSRPPSTVSLRRQFLAE